MARREESHEGVEVGIKVFSAYAAGLIQRMQAAQNTSRETCQGCGFKVRGPYHEKGTHHKTRHPRMRGQ
jgi:hypothetical protein